MIRMGVKQSEGNCPVGSFMAAYVTQAGYVYIYSVYIFSCRGK